MISIKIIWIVSCMHVFNLNSVYDLSDHRLIPKFTAHTLLAQLQTTSHSDLKIYVMHTSSLSLCTMIIWCVIPHFFIRHPFVYRRSNSESHSQRSLQPQAKEYWRMWQNSSTADFQSIFKKRWYSCHIHTEINVKDNTAVSAFEQFFVVQCRFWS